MARSHLRERLVSNTTGLPLSNAVITVREVGTTTALAATMYAGLTGGTTKPNPITSGADGLIDFYLAQAQNVDLRVVAAGYPDATISSVPVLFDQGDIVDKASAQAITGQKTLTSPILNTPQINSPTISTPTFSGGASFAGPVLVPDGTVGAPGFAFGSDTNNGAYRLGSDYWALSAGGVVAMRLALDTYGTRVDFGNSAFGLQGFAIGNVVTINHTTTVNNDGTIGLASSLINNGVLGAAGSGAPDFAAASISVFQTSATAKGSMRSLEAHTIRARADSAAGTAMIGELGLHTSKAGVAGFGTGTTFPGTMGIWLTSYTESNMIALGEVAVPGDVALYISGPPGGGGGAGGWRFPIFVHDVSNTILFRLNDTGVVSLAVSGNAAAPVLTFVGDEDSGFWRIGANGIGLSTGGTERMRVDGSGDFALGNVATVAGSRLLVSGGLIEAAGGVKNNAAFSLHGVISPTQLVANTNDWNPTGLSTAAVIRVSTDAGRNLTGLVAQARRVILMHYIGGATIVLKNNDAGSSAANRFYTPGGVDYTLGANEGVMLWYDDITPCWRIHGT